MNPFQSFYTQPSYGTSSCILTWKLTPGYETGAIYVYRSPTGIDKSGDWELLNPDNPVVGVDFYEDDTLTDRSKFRSYYYRLLLEHSSGDYDSPIVGTYSELLTRSQYGVLYKMRRMEFLRMRHNGVPVFHCIPSTSGEPSAALNPTTSQLAGSSCLAPDSFGTWFANGFQAIVQTRAELAQIGPMDIKDDPEGMSNKEEQSFKLRLLGFPKPEQGHLIVLPYSDLRLIITGNVQPYEFRGFLPVAYDVEAEQLRKDDDRYAIPLPPPQRDHNYPFHASDPIVHTSDD